MHRHKHNRFPYHAGCRGNLIPDSDRGTQKSSPTSTSSCACPQLYVALYVSEASAAPFATCSYLHVSLCVFEEAKYLTG